VGLLASFFRTTTKLAKRSGQTVKGAFKSVEAKMQKGMKHLRTYRFFAKSKEERQTLIRKAVVIAKSVGKKLKKSIVDSPKVRAKGANEASRNKLKKMLTTMERLVPQIESWLTTGFVAKNKIVNLMMPLLRSIPRGKVGKDVEFGIKWGIQRIGGGFVMGTADASRGNFSDQKHVPEAIEKHVETFGVIPAGFAYDRGGCSDGNDDFLDEVGVRHNGIAPKGKGIWKVKNKKKKELVNERSRIEGDIGSIKSPRYGFNGPAARSEEMMIACGHRAMLGYNLNKLMRQQAAFDGVVLIG